MAKKTTAELYALARGAGLGAGAAVVAAAVAMAESGGHPLAQGDVGIQTEKWGPSVGLWQIRSLKADYGTGRTRDAARLTDPAFNAASMATISGMGGNFKPWSVYTSGKYKPYVGMVERDTGTGGVADAITGAQDAVGSAIVDGAGAVVDGAGAVVDAVSDLNPLAVFKGWQDDLQGVAVKLAVTGAALWLIVAGVRSAAGDGTP